MTGKLPRVKSPVATSVRLTGYGVDGVQEVITDVNIGRIGQCSGHEGARCIGGGADAGPTVRRYKGRSEFEPEDGENTAVINTPDGGVKVLTFIYTRNLATAEGEGGIDADSLVLQDHQWRRSLRK